MSNNMFDLDARVKNVNAVAQSGTPNSLPTYTSTCYTSNCYTSTCYTATCYSSTCYTGQQNCGYTYTTGC